MKVVVEDQELEIELCRVQENTVRADRASHVHKRKYDDVIALSQQTQQHKKRKLDLDTAKLRKQGFPDIRSFKRQKTAASVTSRVVLADIGHNEVIDLTLDCGEDEDIVLEPRAMGTPYAQNPTGDENGIGQIENNAPTETATRDCEPAPVEDVPTQVTPQARPRHGVYLEEEEEENEEEAAEDKEHRVRMAGMMHRWHVDLVNAPCNHENHESEAPHGENSEANSQNNSLTDDTQPKPIEDGTSCPYQAPERHSPQIENAIWKLECIHKDKSIDLLFRGRLTVMLALLRLYKASKDIGWVEASMLAATTAGWGAHLACCVRRWCRRFLDDETCLPVNLYGTWKTSLIADEDFSSQIQAYLQSLNKEM